MNETQSADEWERPVEEPASFRQATDGAHTRVINPERNGVVEGVVVDDSAGVDRLCEAMIESTTEFDWRPGTPESLPEELRDGLRLWVRGFRAWDRGRDRRPDGSYSKNGYAS